MSDDDTFWRELVDAASAPYRRSDAHAHRFARAKLSGDRMFRHVIENGLVPPGAAVLDLGCGQGLFASVLHAAIDAACQGRWPDHWAPPPLGAHVTGVDPLPLDIERARTAVRSGATFIRGDMRRFDPPPCDVAIFFDTLQYISRAEQDAVLARVRAALRPGGTMLLRVGDASARLRFVYGLWVDRFTMLLHGGGFGRLTGRTLDDWRATLEPLGLDIDARQMNGRKPFANLLIAARLPVAVAAAAAAAEPATAD